MYSLIMTGRRGAERWWCACVRVSVTLYDAMVSLSMCVRCAHPFTLQKFPTPSAKSLFGLGVSPTVQTVQSGYEQTYHKFERKQCSMLLIFTHTIHTYDGRWRNSSFVQRYIVYS